MTRSLVGPHPMSKGGIGEASGASRVAAPSLWRGACPMTMSGPYRDSLEGLRQQARELDEALAKKRAEVARFRAASLIPAWPPVRSKLKGQRLIIILWFSAIIAGAVGSVQIE